jgi:zinc protease
MQDLPIDYVDTRNAKVEAVTMDDIRRVAKQLLHPDRLIVTVVGKGGDKTVQN